LDAKLTQGRKRVYGFTAIILVLCISLSVFLSLGFNAKVSIQAQESDAQPEALTPNQVTDSSAGDNGVGASASATNSQNKSLITEEEALSIAMPLIEQYAKENNRTVTTVNASFCPSSRDLSGSRGGSSLEDLGKENVTWLSFPCWEIDARFEPVKYEDNHEQYYTTGYSVLIWADNGEIRSAGPQANY
jgi:hypothetical protein